MLNDPNKAGRLTQGLVSALYLAAAVLLGLLLYFTIQNMQPAEGETESAHLTAPAQYTPPSEQAITGSLIPAMVSWPTHSLHDLA